jgi:hypothetical protein
MIGTAHEMDGRSTAGPATGAMRAIRWRYEHSVPQQIGSELEGRARFSTAFGAAANVTWLQKRPCVQPCGCPAPRISEIPACKYETAPDLGFGPTKGGVQGKERPRFLQVLGRNGHEPDRWKRERRRVGRQRCSRSKREPLPGWEDGHLGNLYSGHGLLGDHLE